METSHFKSQAVDLTFHLIRSPKKGYLLNISIFFNIWPYFAPPKLHFPPTNKFNLFCIPNTSNISNEGSHLPLAIT